MKAAEKFPLGTSPQAALSFDPTAHSEPGRGRPAVRGDLRALHGHHLRVPARLAVRGRLVSEGLSEKEAMELECKM